jgi:hypothetical protein
MIPGAEPCMSWTDGILLSKGTGDEAPVLPGSFFNNRRIANYQAVRMVIPLQYHGSSAYDGSFTEAVAFYYDRVQADPAITPDRDGKWLILDILPTQAVLQVAFMTVRINDLASGCKQAAFAECTGQPRMDAASV